jgi:hypothetical protein
MIVFQPLDPNTSSRLKKIGTNEHLKELVKQVLIAPTYADFHVIWDHKGGPVMEFISTFNFLVTAAELGKITFYLANPVSAGSLWVCFRVLVSPEILSKELTLHNTIPGGLKDDFQSVLVSAPNASPALAAAYSSLLYSIPFQGFKKYTVNDVLVAAEGGSLDLVRTTMTISMLEDPALLKLLDKSIILESDIGSHSDELSFLRDYVTGRCIRDSSGTYVPRFKKRRFVGYRRKLISRLDEIYPIRSNSTRWFVLHFKDVSRLVKALDVVYGVKVSRSTLISLSHVYIIPKTKTT